MERPRYAAARFDAERYRKAGLVGRDEPRDRLLSAWETSAEPADADGRRQPSSSWARPASASPGWSRRSSTASRPAAGGCWGLRACRTTPTSPCGRSPGCSSGCSAARARTATGSAALVAHLASLGLDPAAVGARSSARSSGSPRRRSTRRPQLDPSAFLDETLARARGVAGGARAADSAPVRRRGPALGRPLHPRAAGPRRRPASRWHPHRGHDARRLGGSVAGCRPRPRARPPRRRRRPRTRRQPRGREGADTASSAPPSSSRPRGSRSSSRS